MAFLIANNGSNYDTAPSVTSGSLGTLATGTCVVVWGWYDNRFGTPTGTSISDSVISNTWPTTPTMTWTWSTYYVFFVYVLPNITGGAAYTVTANFNANAITGFVAE